MADYIKCKNCDSTDCNGCNIKTLETMLYEGRFDCLMNGNRSINQSADVAPMRHGRWIKCEDGTCYCSECNQNPQEWYERAIKALNYCPNCGSKMDDELNE